MFQLLVGGTVLAALIHVLFAARLGWTLATAVAGRRRNISQRLLGFEAAALLSGYLISAVLGLIGLARRRLLGCAWVLLLMPVYWLLLSLAAWRALLQLLRDPYRWEKTEHGLARTSRLAHVGSFRDSACRSAAASSGRRFMLNGATKRPSLFIR